MNPGIGKPGMIGVGPGQNLRQKSFLGLQKDFKQVFTHLQAHPTPDQASVKGYLDQLKHLQADVQKYCSVPGTNAFLDSYANLITGLGIVLKAYEKKDAKKLAETMAREVPRLHKELKSIVQAQYVAPPAPPAAAPLPPPPTRAAPPTPTAAAKPPARPTSDPGVKK